MKQFQPPSFEKHNSIVYHEPQNKIADLQPSQKNIEIEQFNFDFEGSRFFIIRRLEQFNTKSQKKVTKFWIADASGSCFLNIYHQEQDNLSEGMIGYMSGAYATVYKDQLVVHQGKQGIFKITGFFNMQFKVEPNVSTLKNWGEIFASQLAQK